MQQVGRHREAIELLRGGQRLSKSGAMKALFAGACWKQAKITFRSGHLWASILWVLQACQAETGLLPLRQRRLGMQPEVGGTEVSS